MNRRDFMKTTAVATAGLTVAGVPIRVRPAEEPIPDEYREYDYYSVRRLSVDHYPYIQHIEDVGSHMQAMQELLGMPLWMDRIHKDVLIEEVTRDEAGRVEYGFHVVRYHYRQCMPYEDFVPGSGARYWNIARLDDRHYRLIPYREGFRYDDIVA